MINLKKFVINPTNEFHILRHFDFVSEHYKKTLLGKPYYYYDQSQGKFVLSKITQCDIKSALKVVGTKFNSDVVGIENPKKLLKIAQAEFKKLKDSGSLNWAQNTGFKTTSFTVGYKLPVGKINCLLVSNISTKDKNKIKSAPRSSCKGESSVLVNTITGLKLDTTTTISVELVDPVQLPFFIVTAYPNCSISPNLSFNDLVFVV